MRSLTIAIALALVATVSLSGLASAADSRPMHGRYTVGVDPFVQHRCGDDVTLGFVGTGIATHLGRMEGYGSNCTEPTFFATAVPVWDGLATFVAADGSALNMSYEGFQEEPVGGTASVTSTFTVLSGTGRFAGATGSWTSVGVLDFVSGVFDGKLSGWVAY